MKTTLNILGLCIAALSLLGILFDYSTALTAADAIHFHSQLKCFVAGLVLMLALARMDYAWLQRPWVRYALAAFCLVLLLAVFVPGLAARINGARRWLHGVGQPSEFVKPMVIAMLAGRLAPMESEKIKQFRTGYLPTLLLGGVPALLVFAEPDWGTATLLAILSLSMLVLAGARWTHLAVTAACAVILFSVLVTYDPVRLPRILVFLRPEASQHGDGWQVWQSLLAIGGGGWGGHVFAGSIHKYGYVPEQQSDFIFSAVGQEIGFWGTTLVVVLYLGIFLCGLHIMKHARDRFGYYLAAGCTTLVILQAFMNIGVATSLIPNKGLPLPFMSCGGSSLLSMFACIGLLASVAFHSSDEFEFLRRPRCIVPRAIQLVLF